MLKYLSSQISYPPLIFHCIVYHHLHQLFCHFCLSSPELPEIKSFLKRDICCRYADKYLLTIVFTYFARAGFTKEQYTKENFFAAL